MRAILILALNDLRLLWRDKMAFFWVLGFPLMFAIFFGTIFSGGGSSVSTISLAVVDQDNTEISKKFAEKLNNSNSFSVFYTTEDSAATLVRKGKKRAFIILKKGFADQMMFSFSDDPGIELGIDPSNQMSAGLIQGLIMQKMFEMYRDIFMDTDYMKTFLTKQVDRVMGSSGINDNMKKTLVDLMSSATKLYTDVDTSSDLTGAGKFFTGQSSDSTTATSSSASLDDFMARLIKRVDVSIQRDGPLTSYEVIFPSSVLWGLLACAATFATSIARERSMGTYMRLRVAPINHFQILSGKGLACFIACISVSLFILVLGHQIFGVRFGSISLLMIAIVGCGICFVGIMMLMSVVGKTEQSVSGAGWAIMMVFAMIGGAMIPLVFMPSWMRPISNASPIKWGIVAIEGAIWRDYSLADMFLPVGILVSIGIAGLIIGQYVLAHRND